MATGRNGNLASKSVPCWGDRCTFHSPLNATSTFCPTSLSLKVCGKNFYWNLLTYSKIFYSLICSIRNMFFTNIYKHRVNSLFIWGFFYFHWMALALHLHEHDNVHVLIMYITCVFFPLFTGESLKFIIAPQHYVALLIWLEGRPIFLLVSYWNFLS